MRFVKIIPPLVTIALLGSCSRLPPETASTTAGAEPVLFATMSEAQILRALKLDLSKLKKTVSHGSDGSSTTYSDGENVIGITDSAVSGKSVVRFEPAAQHEMWSLPEGEKADGRGRLKYESLRTAIRPRPTPPHPP